MIDLEKIYTEELARLIAEGDNYILSDRVFQGAAYTSPEKATDAYGWLTASADLLSKLVSDDGNVFVVQFNHLVRNSNYTNQNAHHDCRAALSIMKRLMTAFENGTMGNLKFKFQAETFDDFLSHAEEYLKINKKMESGVIAGIVFEDTIRKIAKKLDIENDGKALETLINALKTGNHIEKTKASRCRVASTVRGTAAHANWDELDIGAVRDTIALTRELLGEFLEK